MRTDISTTATRWLVGVSAMTLAQWAATPGQRMFAFFLLGGVIGWMAVVRKERA
jgi:hypothetical protein